MLRLRALDPDDYIVFEDGQMIGRIRFARERSPALWLWTVVVSVPGAPSGNAENIEQAKSKFETAWEAFKSEHGPEQIASAFERMNGANRTGRFER
ncbi:hypothetical protein [Bradyrhizobium sp. CCBAU 53380]|uniref:hypothetical protein n=1 Tax=Bradyrhizobium sp. CCBAU 53380 TaxID=1325117 RepID=UPI002304A344|nr:hypothetical protein [Bradyrhizobium sp. CCBAU 53380]MDA9427155.1 hypothetical protein [Bradyrhizobium sp. CCBAU 53380]